MSAPTRARSSALALGLASACAIAACSPSVTTESTPQSDEPSGTLIGAGGTSINGAMQGWQAGYQALNPDATVEYDPIGSGGGRMQFLDGAVDFAGSDAFLDDEEFEQSLSVCAGDLGAINLPHFVSSIAIVYNVPQIDGEQLNLRSDVLAAIFTGEITNWSDPAIAADNPHLDLPDLRITPVHRSDKSGTTHNVTDFLSASAPDSWTFGPIDSWSDEGPAGGEGAKQTSGMIAAVAAAEGSIGYADFGQAQDLQVAAIEVAGEFALPSAEGAGRILDESTRLEGRGDVDFAFDINRTPSTPDAYPLTHVTYHIVCLEYEDAGTAALFKDFLSYVASEQGQNDAAESAASAPISAELRAELAHAVDAIGVVSDPA